MYNAQSATSLSSQEVSGELWRVAGGNTKVEIRLFHGEDCLHVGFIFIMS